MDRRNAIVASDSRWSIELPDCLLFVDDTGFDKIIAREGAVMICAGSAQFIELWKAWFLEPTPQIPPTETKDDAGNVWQAICVSIIGRPGFDQLFSAGSYENYEGAAEFCGTGALYAKDCYSVNGCATTAVRSASCHDPMTGGAVKFAQVNEPFDNNLNEALVPLQEVMNQMNERGMAMDKSSGKVVSIAEKFSDNTGAAAALCASKLSAPSGQALRAWTDREKQDVLKVMAQIVRSEGSAKG